MIVYKISPQAPILSLGIQDSLIIENWKDIVPYFFQKRDIG